MKEIAGAYNTAIVYTDMLEDTAQEQIKTLCNQEFAKGCRIRIMPDVHAGAGCVIGFTADMGEKVIPNIVGVDIGCGMLTIELGKVKIEFETLDDIIKKYVPSGKNIHQGRVVKFSQLQEMNCYRELKNSKRIERSIGTLGGGNHFIEIDVDDDENKYLVIHTGSRNLGKQVAEYYQNMAYDLLRGKDKMFEQYDIVIQEYKAAGRKKEIEPELKRLRTNFEAKQIDIPKELCYLTGKYRMAYLEDMKICQKYATQNRYTIADIILEKLFDKSIGDYNHFETIHNYVDYDSNIIRKGAVSARQGEKILIPINMRDGSLICIGKGNAEWNFSAPHGAGRLFSRNTARGSFTMEEFTHQMEGVYSTSINESTLDECPMAYKNMSDIVNNITPTAEIIKIIKPIYNFKAGE